MEQKKKKRSGVWGMVVGFLAGGALGVAMAVYMVHTMPEGLTSGQELGRMIIMLLMLYAAILLQIIIHEAGHLIFGLISGYQFVSFRVGNLQLTRSNGKLKLSRHSIAGTAGQCLLSPPDLADGKMPVMLYNLGGALANLLSAAIFAVVSVVLSKENIFSFLWLSMAFFGLLYALTNGIPMRLGNVDNDGYNAMSLGKNKDAMGALWLQLKVNAELANGKRLKELPDEWFIVPTDEAMGNSMVAAIGVFACNRLIDQNRYAEADALMERMLSMESGMAGVYRNMLICDRMCCEMIQENRRDIVERMHTAELKDFMKSMKKSPSIIRTEYIYALLVEQDPKKAASILEKFEKIGKNYPYPNDMQSDRELIAAAQCKAD